MQYPFCEVKQCGYCHRFAYTFSGHKNKVISYGALPLLLRDGETICDTCLGHYEQLFDKVEVFECLECGDKFRRSERKAFAKLKPNRVHNGYVWGAIQRDLYFDVCKKSDCLSEYKFYRETQYKERGLRIYKRGLNKELKQLKTALKGN